MAYERFRRILPWISISLLCIQYQQNGGSVVEGAMNYYRPMTGRRGGVEYLGGPNRRSLHSSSVSVRNMSSESSSAVATSGSGGNPITQLASFIADSFRRFVTGSKLLYSNYQTCNTIRAKQKTGGGISFQEFEFLRKGKEDRSRLGNIIFLMVFSSSMLPYALMFFPDMLPSPFQPIDKLLNKYETSSRTRAHAVIETLLSMEKAETTAPISSKFNPFSGGAVRREMARITELNASAGSVFAATDLDDLLYLLKDIISFPNDISEKDKTRELNLISIPKPLMKGIGRSLGLSNFFPNFMLRSKVLEHLKVVEESDQFLINEKVNLDSLNRDTLLDSCQLRFIGNPQSTEDELRSGLASWLKYSSKRENTSENENVKKIAMLCYNAVLTVKDPRCASALPRIMFTSNTSSSSIQDRNLVSVAQLE